MAGKQSLLGTLEEREKKNRITRVGKLTVLSRKAEIQDALEKGYSVKAVYESLVEMKCMQISYSSFARLVKKYIKKDKIGCDQRQQIHSGVNSLKAKLFNPTPNKDDLI